MIMLSLLAMKAFLYNNYLSAKLGGRTSAETLLLSGSGLPKVYTDKLCWYNIEESGLNALSERTRSLLDFRFSGGMLRQQAPILLNG
jgi:hypothetical protein